MTEPTESRSRFRARPNVLSLNSSISPCIASDRPWMRQIPSVTVTTVPWVRTSVSTPSCWIRLRSSSLISEGFSCILDSELFVSCLCVSRGQLHPHRIQPRTHRTVEHLVADRHSYAADQLRLHPHLGLEPARELAGKALEQIAELCLAERECRFDQAVGAALGVVLQAAELRGNFGQGRQATVFDRDFQE